MAMRSGLKQAVLALRREDKSRWERRAPLAPKHISKLVGLGAQVIVQPSPTRVFTDGEYAAAGAHISEDLRPAQTILAVKEVPIKLLLPNKTYMFFSHTIKAQPYNMPLLDSILANNIRLIDYERIVNSKNDRLVKFGKYAGNAGMIDVLPALGDRLLALGHATPLLYLSASRAYPSLEKAKASVREVGQMIKEQGIAKELHPLSFVFTGPTGAVGKGALEVFKELPHKFVTAEELAHMQKTGSGDRNVVYGVLASSEQIVKRKDGQPYTREAYHSHPEQFESVFAEKFLPNATVVVNCQYWEPRFPRIISKEQLHTLRAKGNKKLVAVQDISCDVNGSVEFTSHVTTIDNPSYLHDDVLVMAVDNLPAELPRDSTEAFGDLLMPFVEPIARGEELPVELERATIAMDGRLTKEYEYIQELRQQTRGKRVLILGAGLVARPAVQYLVKCGYEVTVAADDEKAVAALQKVDKSVKGAKLAVSEDSKAALEKEISKHDVVLSLVPAVLHPFVAQACIATKKHFVTASYISPALKGMDAEAKNAGIAMFNEAGLDPGIDHVEAMVVIDGAKAVGAEIKEFTSYCGGLPAPEFSNNPLGYKFSWSPRGVLNAAKAPARFIAEGKIVEHSLALDCAQPLRLWNGFNLEGYPNRDSVSYGEIYGIPNADVVLRGTLRYEGYSEIVSTMYKIGLLEDRPNPNLASHTWHEIMEKMLRRSEVEVSDRTQAAFEWLGLYEKAPVVGTSVIDALCRVLQEKLVLNPDERDLVLLQHDFLIAYPNGKKERRTLSLVEYGEENGATAMSKTVGIPAAIAVRLILDGHVTRTGCFAPMTPDVYLPMQKLLHEAGLKCRETITEVA